jgi:hypothetical protein
MRRALWLSVFLCLPLPIHAESVSYMFTGTWGQGSLDVGSGLVDVTGVSFVALGTTLSDGPLLEDCEFCRYVSTTTYSFGDLGSFTTDAGGDFFTQYGDENGIISLALQKWVDGMIDFIGFRVSISPIGDPTVLAALGEVTLSSPLASIGHGRRQTNAAGHYLTLEHSLSTRLTVSKAGIYAVPVTEPHTSVLLILVGTLILMCDRMAASRYRRETNYDVPGISKGNGELRQ